jgi:histidinol-phosphate aminotransferase
VQAPDEHALVSRLAEHAIAVRPGTALGIPGTVRVRVPSQRGLRLLPSALRPTTGQATGRVMPTHGDRIT